jgi:hypothetical protein
VSRQESQEAVRQYEKESWRMFHRIRVSTSKARSLVSESAYKKLETFYRETLVKFDVGEVRRVIQDQKGHDDLNKLIFNEFSDQLEKIIYFLSQELRLTKAAAAEPSLAPARWLDRLKWWCV